jgi:hypothetical protein
MSTGSKFGLLDYTKVFPYGRVFSHAKHSYEFPEWDNKTSDPIRQDPHQICLRNHPSLSVPHSHPADGGKGINHKIKVIKPKAYGFHDVEYFSLIIKCAFAQ